MRKFLIVCLFLFLPLSVNAKTITVDSPKYKPKTEQSENLVIRGDHKIESTYKKRSKEKWNHFSSFNTRANDTGGFSIGLNHRIRMNNGYSTRFNYGYNHNPKGDDQHTFGGTVSKQW